MTLSHRTDFALRTLMFLARSQRDSPESRNTSAEIAHAFGIPLNHLAKIVNDLARLGYLRTTRGPGGGVALAKSPADIRLGQLIEALQGPLRLHDCVATRGLCVIESFCRLRILFAEADVLQRDFLNHYTLADVIPGSPSPAEALLPAGDD